METVGFSSFISSLPLTIVRNRLVVVEFGKDVKVAHRGVLRSLLNRMSALSEVGWRIRRG